MRTKLITLLSLTLLLSTPVVALAFDASTSASARAAAEDSLKAARQAARTADQLTHYKDAATKYISDRIGSLQKLSARISGNKLTPDQKSALIGDISGTITGLQALQTKIGGDTDVATIKTDVRSIFESYRVYEVLMPKVEGLMAVDRLSGVVTKLQAAGTKVKGLIDKAAAKGVNTTQMSSFYNDFLTQISNAQTQISTASGDFNAMKVSDPTGARTLFQSGKQALAAAKADLINAHKDLQSIIPLLKTALVNQASGSATPATGSATTH